VNVYIIYLMICIILIDRFSCFPIWLSMSISQRNLQRRMCLQVCT